MIIGGYSSIRSHRAYTFFICQNRSVQIEVNTPSTGSAVTILDPCHITSGKTIKLSMMRPTDAQSYHHRVLTLQPSSYTDKNQVGIPIHIESTSDDYRSPHLSILDH